MVRAIELGYPQREISRAAYQYQQKVENGQELLVGINTHADAEEVPLDILQISPQSEWAQIDRLRQFRRQRDQESSKGALTNCGMPQPLTKTSSPIYWKR